MLCPACDAPNPPEATRCKKCGERLRGRSRREREDEYEEDEEGEDALQVLVPYKNTRALLSYYFGVFSLIPFLGNVLGPAALLLGILGIKYANAHPQAKGKGHAIAGIVLGTLTILAWWVAPAVLFLVAAVYG